MSGLALDVEPRDDDYVIVIPLKRDEALIESSMRIDPVRDLNVEDVTITVVIRRARTESYPLVSG